MTNTPKALEQQRTRRRALVNRGLTVYGTKRKNYQWPELAGLSGYERAKKRITICNRRRRKLAAAFKFFKISPIEPQAGRQLYVNKVHLRKHIDDAAEALNLIFDKLDFPTQRICLRLARSLTAIRHQIL